MHFAEDYFDKYHFLIINNARAGRRHFCASVTVFIGRFSHFNQGEKKRGDFEKIPKMSAIYRLLL
jgi:hypothetical protein